MQLPYASTVLLLLLNLSTALPLDSDSPVLDDLSPRGYGGEGVASLSISTFPNAHCLGHPNSYISATYNNNNPIPASFASFELSRPLLANETIDFSVQSHNSKLAAGKPGVPRDCTKFDHGLRAGPLNPKTPGLCWTTSHSVTCWRLRIPREE